MMKRKSFPSDEAILSFLDDPDYWEREEVTDVDDDGMMWSRWCLKAVPEIHMWLPYRRGIRDFLKERTITEWLDEGFPDKSADAVRLVRERKDIGLQLAIAQRYQLIRENSGVVVAYGSASRPRVGLMKGSI